jgi:hypothetical protein
MKLDSDSLLWFKRAAIFSGIFCIVCLLLALFFQFIAPITLAMEGCYLISAMSGAGCIGSLIEVITGT